MRICSETGNNISESKIKFFPELTCNILPGMVCNSKIWGPYKESVGRILQCHGDGNLKILSGPHSMTSWVAFDWCAAFLTPLAYDDVIQWQHLSYYPLIINHNTTHSYDKKRLSQYSWPIAKSVTILDRIKTSIAKWPTTSLRTEDIKNPHQNLTTRATELIKHVVQMA